jgi:hypothetical protein
MAVFVLGGGQVSRVEQQQAVDSCCSSPRGFCNQKAEDGFWNQFLCLVAAFCCITMFAVFVLGCFSGCSG